MKYFSYRGMGDENTKMLQIDEGEQLILHIYDSNTKTDRIIDVYANPGVLHLTWEDNAYLIDW